VALFFQDRVNEEGGKNAESGPDEKEQEKQGNTYNDYGNIIGQQIGP